MLRIVRQHRERPAVPGLHREHAQARIHRTRRPDNVRAFVTRMHVRAHGHVPERIFDGSVRPANPTTIVRVRPVVHRPPVDPGRLEIFERRADRRCQPGREPRDIVRIGPAPQAAHRRSRRVRVRGGNHHALRRQSRLPGRHRLGPIDQVPRQHAGVHDAEDDFRGAIVQHEAPRVQRVHRLLREPLRHIAIHPYRKSRRRDVDGRRARAKPRARRISLAGQAHAAHANDESDQ